MPLKQAVVYLKLANISDARAGKKLGGGRFTAYRQSYIKWLARTGRSGSGKKWLWLSGEMMHGMKTRVGRTRAEVGYWNKNKAEMLANVHQKGRSDGTIPARPWFGWRQGYVEYIENQIMWPWIRGEVFKSGLEFKVSI